MKGRRAFGLLLVMSVGLLCFTVLLVSCELASAARHRANDARYRLAAEALSRSGLTYAKGMLRHHQWSGSGHFRSDEFPTGGYFVVDYQAQGSQVRIRSRGVVGWRSQTVEETVRL